MPAPITSARIDHADRDGARTTRTVLPLAVMYTEGCLTLLAWCCLSEDFRMFRVDWIAVARDGGRSFRPQRGELLRDHLAWLQAARPGRQGDQDPAATRRQGAFASEPQLQAGLQGVILHPAAETADIGE